MPRFNIQIHKRKTDGQMDRIHLIYVDKRRERERERERERNRQLIIDRQADKFI